MQGSWLNHRQENEYVSFVAQGTVTAENDVHVGGVVEGKKKENSSRLIVAWQDMLLRADVLRGVWVAGVVCTCGEILIVRECTLSGVCARTESRGAYVDCFPSGILWVSFGTALFSSLSSASWYNVMV